ncbi:MAG: sulfatase-like hydrolase/transferase, partial [Myxococcales bacterium]|nr:sulfatase-like hydrolase/transferase [Myxococcales bacterium]
ADHGEGFGEHNAYYHGTTLYEEMVRVPLVIHHPALHPRVVDSRVSLIDLAPTILDLFGVATPGSYMGQTLAPVLAGGSLAATRPIYLDSQRGLTGMVFEDGHKLLVDDGLPELYDLDADPGEEENIYDGGDHARRHLGELRAFEKAHQMVPVRRQ